MLSKMNKIKLLGCLLLLVCLIVFFVWLKNYSEQKKYEEQSVMAHLYLEDGSYELAIEAFLRALSMKHSDQEPLSIGLAEAYIGLNDYNKALEVLRASYQATGGFLLKEKIEEVTGRKIDYDFNMTIIRADRYYSNQEFDKAIAEYERAKLIKSKEAISYLKIAESHIGKGDYTSAREEIIEGLAITQSEELNRLLSRVDLLVLQVQYEEIIEIASDYFRHENYEDAIFYYERAIDLMQKDERGFIGLAEAYIETARYDSAITLLQSALLNLQSSKLNELMDKASELKNAKDNRQRILSELYKAANQLDIRKISSLMQEAFFKNNIASDTIVYYNPEGDTISGYGLIIYDSRSIYSGGIEKSMRRGMGIFFMQIEGELGTEYYYYAGEWNNNMPNGIGKTGELKLVRREDGSIYRNLILTEGIYYNGIENGLMRKFFYEDDIEMGSVTYLIKNGVPEPILDEEGEVIFKEDTEDYAIGIISYQGTATNDYYYINPKSILETKPFVKQ